MNRKQFLARSIGIALSLGLLSVPMSALTPNSILTSTVESNIVFAKAERVAVIAGTVQSRAGAAKDWDPSDMTTRMNDIGNGFYTYTVDLPAGAYYYKVAINGSWAENYGLDGNFDGANVQLNLTKPERITFYYNDITHKIKDSTTYKMLDESELPKLGGNFGSFTMYDLMLDQFYQTDVELQAGSYEVAVEQKGGAPLKQTINITQSGKVTFYYESSSGRLIVDDGRIHEDKICHDSWSSDYRVPFEAVKVGEPITLSIATQHGDVQDAKLILYKAKLTAKGGDEYNPDFSEGDVETYRMNLKSTKDNRDFWSVTFSPKSNGIYGYKFLLNNVKEYGDDAKSGHIGEVKLRGAKPYQLTVYSADYHTPDWAKEAVVYQIFPDRFFNGDKSNDNARQSARGHQPLQHRAWNELPANHSKSPEQDDEWECNDFFGGDLAGITKKLDYLKELGITAIYVNPIMNACSNHRYDAVDYGNLDPLLGDMQSFRTLASEMSKRDMRLIMDGVFNHVGDDSIYFDRYGKYKWVGAYEYWSRVYDLVNNKNMTEAAAKAEVTRQLQAEGQEFSPYHWENWFDIRNEKTRDDMGEKYAYHDWQGFSSLVAFHDEDYPGSENGKRSSALGNYLLYDKDAVITHRFKEGLSGWRFDVAKEIPSGFWENVRREVKQLRTFDGKEPLLLGEIWQDGSQFLTGDQFDSVMNYKLSFAVGDLFLMQGDAKAADDELKILRQNYPREALYDLMNIVDSHDTIRAIYKFGGGKEGVAQATLKDFDYQLGKARLKLATVFLMGYPGMPTIYYGDEAGVYGSADPDCRRTYPWGKEDKELIKYYRKVIAVRNNNKALFAHGDVETLKAEGDIYAFSRTNGSKAAIVILNRGSSTQLTLDAPFADGTKFMDQLGNYSATVSGGKLKCNLGENQALMLLKM